MLSLVNATQNDLNRQAKLLEYANTKRNAGDFNDVTIQAGAESISANRLVLACYSKFFEIMFHSRFKERNQTTVEIKEFDGQAVRSIIEYIYTGKIDISANNVMTLLGIADFLQVDDVKVLCFDFVESSLTVNNYLDIIKVSILYNNITLLQQTYEFISKNFDKLMQENSFWELSKEELISLLTNIDRNTVQETSLYTAILIWVNYQQIRMTEFPSLFLILDFQRLSPEFVLNTIAQEPLVKNSEHCLNAALSSVTNRIKDTLTQEDKASKLLCFGGEGKKSVSEVYNIFGKMQNNNFPNLSNILSRHRALKTDNFLYCLGGAVEGKFANPTNKVFRLSLSTSKPRWKEIASMKERRCNFGATTCWNGNLVVSGGFNGSSLSNSTELYERQSNKWKRIALMNKMRIAHEMVVADNKLFAIGGTNDYSYLSSVEQLDNVDEKWKVIKSMNVKRSLFAAVACNNFVYAIGGVSNGETHKTVEKYDLNKSEWSFVTSMNVERSNHVACVLKGKIFVVGGLDARNNKIVRTIDCYDPATNEWKIVGETEQDFCNHAAVAV